MAGQNFTINAQKLNTMDTIDIVPSNTETVSSKITDKSTGDPDLAPGQKLHNQEDPDLQTRNFY